MANKTGLFTWKQAAVNSREWWKKQGYAVRTVKVKGGWVNYLTKK